MVRPLDIGISICYILGIVFVGLWVSLRKKKRQTGSESDEYFLAGKSLKWPTIGLALFATNISCLHLVALAQSGFDTGLLDGNFEWMAGITLIGLALFFAPFYIRSGVATLPDFLERRYNSACRDWLAFISVVSAVIIHIAFSFLAGGIVLETLFGINMYVSVTVIALLTAVYTILGGLTAVVVTESIQTVVLVVGAVIITGAAWIKLGGWHPLMGVLEQTHSLNKLSMLRPGGDPSGLPWYSIFLGYPVIGIWYWCADQTIVQRVLGARDENHARVGSLFCGFIKILPVFIFVLPGLFAFALAHRGLLNLDSVTSVVAGHRVVDSKGIYTLMITQLLPTGLVGVLVAALLSGLMSQIAGALNSIATLVSFDLYRRIKPGATDRQLVGSGKIVAGLALLGSIALLPALNQYESLFNGINDIIAHIAPPITCVFVLGVFWKKASPRSAQWTLWLGSLLGAGVYALGKMAPSSPIGRVPFMMMSFYLFCICIAIQVIFSVVSPAPEAPRRPALSWNSVLEPLRARGWKGLGNYKLLSAGLILIMGVLYYLFR